MYSNHSIVLRYTGKKATGISFFSHTKLQHVDHSYAPPPPPKHSLALSPRQRAPLSSSRRVSLNSEATKANGSVSLSKLTVVNDDDEYHGDRRCGRAGLGVDDGQGEERGECDNDPDFFENESLLAEPHVREILFMNGLYNVRRMFFLVFVCGGRFLSVRWFRVCRVFFIETAHGLCRRKRTLCP